MLPKFKIEAGVLIPAMNTIGRATGGRATSPVTRNRVRLSAHDGDVNVVGVSETLEVWANLPAKVAQEGGAIVEYGDLCNFFSDVKGEISTSDEGRLRFDCNKSQMSVAVIDPSEFPDGVDIEGTEIHVSFDMFNALIKQAGLAHNAKVAPILGAIHIWGDGTTAYVESSNNYYAAQGSFASNKHFNVTPDALSLVRALNALANADGDLMLRFGRNRLGLWRGDWGASVTLIEGEFPLVSRIMNAESAVRFEANRAEFLSALKRVRVTSANGNDMKLVVTKGKVNLSSTSDDSDADVDVAAKTRGDYVVNLSDDYMGQTLGVLQNETFVFENESPTKPIYVRQNGVSHAIMPIYKSEREARSNQDAN